MFLCVLPGPYLNLLSLMFSSSGSFCILEILKCGLMFLEEASILIFKQACSKLYNNVKPGELQKKKKILHQSKLSEHLEVQSDILLPK